MKGAYDVIVQNNRVQYRFTVRRNITILRGNSATGKSTLIGLIAQYSRNGEKSGVRLVCSRKCIVLTNDFWHQRLAQASGSLVFIDEDSDFIQTEEFASAARNSDCYFIIVTRITLPNLPYSADEIYELSNVTRGYGRIRRLYAKFQHIYTDRNMGYAKDIEKPDCIIVEDSNSGYQFFREIFADAGIEIISANGNSGICDKIWQQPEKSEIVVIADGAAYGPYIERTLDQHWKWNIVLFLPESFEWMILKSGLIEGNETEEILDDPSEYIESRRFFSWERFFTKYLTDVTKDSYLQYTKRELNPVYLQERERNAVSNLLPEQIGKYRTL